MEHEKKIKRAGVVIAIIARDGKILICRRRRQDTLGGFWEFPGGKIEPDETAEQCLARELLEELLIRVRPVEALDVIDHDYPGNPVRLHPYLCHHADGEPQPLTSEQVIWIDPADLTKYSFPPANESLIQQLTGKFANAAV